VNADDTEPHGARVTRGYEAGADLSEQASEPLYDVRPSVEARLRSHQKLRAKRVVQRIIRAALGAAGRATSPRLSAVGPLRAGDPRVRRILVVRVDLIGDAVLSLPAIRALRRAYPWAEIDMLVPPSVAGVLAGHPDLSRVVIWNPQVWRRPVELLQQRNWREAAAIIARLRAPRYDLCVSISGDWGSVLARLSGARRRVGYAGEAYAGFMTDPVPGGRYMQRKHEVEYVLELARAAGGIVVEDEALPMLHVTSAGEAGARHVLERAGVVLDGRPLVVLHAGAQNGQAKRWPPSHWATLADRLVSECGADVVLTGAASDAPLTAAIRRRMRRPVYDLTGQTSLPALVALLARCDLLVSGDSGPLHIACAVGTPVVGLYGPTDPLISGPLAPDAIVLRREIWCGPCYDASATADCRFHNPVCMKQLPPAAVLDAARRQLARRVPEEVATHPARSGDTHGALPGQHERTT
jgi:lipopolysaccharide heptosyltransferase II